MPDRRLVAVGVAVFAAVVLNLLVPPGTALTRVRSAAADPLAFSGVVLALYLVRPALAWPMTVLAGVVGFGFGFSGLPVALLGAVVTAVPPYAAARWATASEVENDDATSASGGRACRVGQRYFETVGGVRGVAAARLAPVPSDPTSLAAGACGVPPRAYALGTLVGETPWVVAAVAVGASAGSLATGGVTSVSPALVVVGCFGAGVLVAGPAYRRLTDGDGTDECHQKLSEQS